MVNISSSSRYKINRSNLKKSVDSFMIEKGLSDNIIVNLIFVGKNKMKKLAKTYKKEKEALPVLAFTYNEINKDCENLLGEIFVCYPQAVLLAAERNRKVEETLMYLVKHGVENLLK